MNIGPITAPQLRRHVCYLADRIGERNVFRPAQLQATAEYLAEIWHQQGYQTTHQHYRVAGVDSSNLEITLPGTTHPEQLLLVGAHYESVQGSPGANDNGSGIAALLALSGALAACRPRRSLRFVAFTNEEPPFFHTRHQGSFVYAKAARRRGDDIRLMIALETVGSYSDRPGSQHYPPLFRLCYPDRANFIAFVSNFRSRRAMRELVHAFRAATDFPCEHVAISAMVPGVAWSDHLSFWRHRYRAVMVTDTAFYRYPYYHSHEDKPDKLDYTRFAAMTNGLLGALATLADIPPP